MPLRDRLVALALLASTTLTAIEPVIFPIQARADERVRQATGDYERTIGEGMLTGVVAGCAIGLFVGVLGGHRGDAAKGCAAGAVAGGIGGLFTGIDVAEQKKAQIAAEGRMDEAIGKARAQNASLKRLVGSVNALVDRRRKEVAALAALPDRGPELARLKADLAVDVSDVDAAIAAAQKSRDKLKAAVEAYRGQPEEGQLGRETGTNAAALGTLQSRRKDLQQMGAGL
jgi:hypothetical protein